MEVTVEDPFDKYIQSVHLQLSGQLQQEINKGHSEDRLIAVIREYGNIFAMPFPDEKKEQAKNLFLKLEKEYFLDNVPKYMRSFRRKLEYL